MFIEVNKIPPKGLEIDRTLSIAPIALTSGEQAEVRETRLSGTVRRTGTETEFRGEVDAVVTLRCSRCLAEFVLAVKAPCHRIFRKGPLGNPESEHDLVEEDLALTPYDGTRIDLKEITEEQIYLAIPLKPLCREGCRGLCSRSGAELNAAPCGCPEGQSIGVPLTSKLSL